MELPDLQPAIRPKDSAAFQPDIRRMPFPMRFGLFMARHPGRIALIQWGMVGFYLFLLFAPLVFPDKGGHTISWHDLQRFSLFVFWGFGWPLIMLSTMIFGRVWCGIFCPDGTLTETISHYGKKRSIPRWIRWPGWPCLTLLLYTLALFLSGAVRHHGATVILLGSLTLGALLTGFLFGNGRRIWCMYLCPSNAIFLFLAKLASFHFRVDPEKWGTYQGPAKRINCAPLIHIKQMKSASLCHACGRCCGYRNAVELATRKPDAEILSGSSGQTSGMHALTLLFGMIGMGTATLFFSQIPAGNLPAISLQAMLCLVSGSGLLLGLFLLGLIRLSCRITRAASLSWQQLSLGMIPLAGTGLFLGFTAITLSQAESAIWVMQGIFMLQLLLLASAFLFSLWLGWRLIRRESAFRRAAAATAVYAVAPGVLSGIWILALLA